MRGDRVEVVVDTGGGASQTYEIAATRAGWRVEVNTARGVLQVSELTRSGTVVRSGRFMSARVIAVVEHPAEEATGRQAREHPRLELEDTVL